MSFQVVCDNPTCESTLSWNDPETIPDGWWLLEMRPPAQGEDNGGAREAVQYAVCSARCVRGIAETLFDADNDLEPRG